MNQSNAEICRRRGWEAGTIVQVEHEEGLMRWTISAVGRYQVLGYQVGLKSWGFSWSAWDESIIPRRETIIGFTLYFAEEVDSEIGKEGDQ